jgi:hypothetical protein
MLYVDNTHHWISVNKTRAFLMKIVAIDLLKVNNFHLLIEISLAKKFSLEKRVFNQIFWGTLMKSVFNIHKWMVQNLMILEW